MLSGTFVGILERYALTVFCFLCRWEIGRPVSFSPLEMAKVRYTLLIYLDS